MKEFGENLKLLGKLLCVEGTEHQRGSDPGKDMLWPLEFCLGAWQKPA